MWWRCGTARHIDDITVILFVGACYLKSVAGHSARSELIHYGDGAACRGEGRSVHDLSHSHNMLQLTLFICSPDFLLALLLSTLQILQTPPRVLFSCRQQQKCGVFFIISRPARLTWQCLLVSKNCSEVRVDGEHRAGSTGGGGVGTEQGMGEQLHKIATRTLTRLPTMPRCGDVI